MYTSKPREDYYRFPSLPNSGPSLSGKYPVLLWTKSDRSRAQFYPIKLLRFQKDSLPGYLFPEVSTTLRNGFSVKSGKGYIIFLKFLLGAPCCPSIHLGWSSEVGVVIVEGGYSPQTKMPGGFPLPLVKKPYQDILPGNSGGKIKPTGMSWAYLWPFLFYP